MLLRFCDLYFSIHRNPLKFAKLSQIEATLEKAEVQNFLIDTPYLSYKAKMRCKASLGDMSAMVRLASLLFKAVICFISLHSNFNF